MSDWQPIESAPKTLDKWGLTPRIILACPPVNASGWTVGEGFWRSTTNVGWVLSIDPETPTIYVEPTHWQPIPEPPK